MSSEDERPAAPPTDGGRPGELEIGVKTIEVPGYSGPDRRKGERRTGALDRRELLRFEPDRAPRRCGHDRRGPRSVWDGRNEA